MRALEFIRDHVTFKLPYDFSYDMKTPIDTSDLMLLNCGKEGGSSSRIPCYGLQAIEVFVHSVPETVPKIVP